MVKFLTRKRDGRKFPVSGGEKEYRKEYHSYGREDQDYNVVKHTSGTPIGTKSNLPEAKKLAKKKVTSSGSKSALRITKDVGYVERTRTKKQKARDTAFEKKRAMKLKQRKQNKKSKKGKRR